MSKKVRESKAKIYSLAQLASNKINENKILRQEISFCENQLNITKEFLLKCTEFEGDEIMKKKMIEEGINNMYNNLKNSFSKLKKDINIISQKLEAYEDEIFENTEIKDILKNKRTDNLILLSQLKEKDYEISKIKKHLEEMGPNNLFISDKKEIKVPYNVGDYYFDKILEDLTKKLNKELLYFNFFDTNITRLNSKKITLSNKLNLLSDIVQILKDNKKKGTKIYKEDEKNKILDDYNNDINVEEISTKEQKVKIELLTVSQLFDINNEEGKDEAIIDYELHSDDETVFEVKIKQPKKISKDDYLKKIKKQVPSFNLSQIEYNKKKVVKDADLYSIENRIIEVEDIDGQIKEMKKIKKEMTLKCRKNIKKSIAMKNFIKKLKSDWQSLKALKLKTSVIFFDMKKINNNIANNKHEGLPKINEASEDEKENDNIKKESFDNNLEDENNFIEDIQYTQRLNKFKKKKNLINKNSGNIPPNKINEKKKKKNKETKIKIKRAKSK